MVSRGRDDYKKVSINVGDYREQHEQSLRELAISSAGKAKKYGRNISLHPMSPYDRRIIHTTVQEFDGANSFSVGEGSDRRVVIAPDPQYRRQDDRRGGGGRGGNMQRNQRNAQPRRFSGDRGDSQGQGQGGGGYQKREGGYQQREGGYQPREGGGYRDRDRAPRQAPPAQPSRPPRSDASGMGRYGKIEPKDKEKSE